MKTASICFFVITSILIAIGLLMDVTVSSTYNMGLLSTRASIFTVAAGLLTAGAIFACGSVLAATLCGISADLKNGSQPSNPIAFGAAQRTSLLNMPLTALDGLTAEDRQKQLADIAVAQGWSVVDRFPGTGDVRVQTGIHTRTVGSIGNMKMFAAFLASNGIR